MNSENVNKSKFSEQAPKKIPFDASQRANRMCYYDSQPQHEY